jgi:epoxide hydrolase-like protein
MSSSSLPARFKYSVNAAVAFLRTVIVAGAFGLALPVTLSYAETASVADIQIAAAAGGSILPFRIHVPEAALVELRRRMRTTRRRDRETVDDESQGIRLSEIQALVHYWGSGYNALARQAPPGLLRIHQTMPVTIPANLVKGINGGDPAPTGPADPERQAYNALSTFFGINAAYGAVMVTRPQTIGYALADSPSGLAAWTYEKIAEWTDSDGHPERVISRDEILDDITLYWLTNTGASSSRFYWENNNNNFIAAAQKTNQIKVPVAITVFPHEIYRAGKLVTAGLSVAVLLSRSHEGRPFCRLGTTRALQ